VIGLNVLMSLVVAEIYPSGIAIVADTKITYPTDEARTRRSFANSLVKIILLRDDVAVGVTGEDPHQSIRKLIELRDQPVPHLIAVMERMPDAAFVLASLSPTLSLWQVADGRSEDRTQIGRSWAGDRDAYSLFQQRYHEWPEQMGLDPQFLLMSSMQWLLSFQQVASVGAFLTRATTTGGTFRFVDDIATVGPWLLNWSPGPTPSSVSLTVPAGGDASSYQVIPAVGAPPTAGAIAYYIPQAEVAWLFCHDSPWKSETIRAASLQSVIQSAQLLFGQTLVNYSRPMATSPSTD
jgi:hypothetical protein